MRRETNTSVPRDPASSSVFWISYSDRRNGKKCMDRQKRNKNIRFTISFIYCRVYDRVVHVGRRFIVKMTTECSIQLIHLFIERGNCRHERRAYALAYKREKEIHSEHGCVRYSDTSFQGVSRWIIDGWNCMSLILLLLIIRHFSFLCFLFSRKERTI